MTDKNEHLKLKSILKNKEAEMRDRGNVEPEINRDDTDFSDSNEKPIYNTEGQKIGPDVEVDWDEPDPDSDYVSPSGTQLKHEADKARKDGDTALASFLYNKLEEETHAFGKGLNYKR